MLRDSFIKIFLSVMVPFLGSQSDCRRSRKSGGERKTAHAITRIKNPKSAFFLLSRASSKQDAATEIHAPRLYVHRSPQKRKARPAAQKKYSLRESLRVFASAKIPINKKIMSVM